MRTKPKFFLERIEIPGRVHYQEGQNAKPE
jgi:hypothetical protein